MDVRIECHDLKLGMFVSELDRPWEDTNFMFQGFMITSAEQISELQSQCVYVIVSQEKSKEGLFSITEVAIEEKPIVTPTLKNLSQVSQLDQAERLQLANPIKLGKGLLSTIKKIGQELISKKSDLPDDNHFNPLKSAMTLQLEEDERKAEIKRRQDVRIIRNKFSGQPNVPDNVVDYMIKTTVEEELVTAKKVSDRIQNDLGITLFAEMTSADLSSRINVAKEVLSEVVDSIVRNPSAMLLVTNIKRLDDIHYQHAIDFSIMMVSFGRQLGIPKAELNHIALGGLLHDIGKSKVEKMILDKPNRLSSEEYQKIKLHIEYGSRMLDDIPDIHPIVRQIVERHHERYDGQGYPEALSAERIGIYGSMAGIVETYATMTSHQPYADARTSAKAVSVLVAMRDKAFQAELVDQFIQVVGVYPIGSIVQLSSGEIGIVSRQNKLWRLKPLVTVIIDANGNKLSNTYVIDLSKAVEKDSKSLSIVNELPSGIHGIDARDYFI